jgi:hypothetical protein
LAAFEQIARVRIQHESLHCEVEKWGSRDSRYT